MICCVQIIVNAIFAWFFINYSNQLKVETFSYKFTPFKRAVRDTSILLGFSLKRSTLRIGTYKLASVMNSRLLFCKWKILSFLPNQRERKQNAFTHFHTFRGLSPLRLNKTLVVHRLIFLAKTLVMHEHKPRARTNRECFHPSRKHHSRSNFYKARTYAHTHMHTRTYAMYIESNSAFWPFRVQHSTRARTRTHPHANVGAFRSAAAQYRF